MITTPTWRQDAAELRYLAATVARVHGASHPAMATLAEVVDALADSRDDDRAAHAALVHRLRELTSGFTPWEDACASVRRLFAGLASLAALLSAPPEYP